MMHQVGTIVLPQLAARKDSPALAVKAMKAAGGRCATLSFAVNVP
jgi:hypothetical protein